MFSYIFVLFYLLCGRGLWCIPISDEDVDDVNSIDSLSPDERGGKLVQIWMMNSGVNSEELGSLFEGDIRQLPRPLSRNLRNALINEESKWDNARVPYVIEDDFKSTDKKVILQAMDIYHKYTCIRFVPRNKTDNDFIAFQNDEPGCWSPIGRVHGEQKINLETPKCIYVNDVLHEMMHALGFHHEHNRHDRDDYVTILFENVKEEEKHNFNKPNESTTSFGVPYDYNSIVHYVDYAFNKEDRTDGKKTIVPKEPAATIIMGQNGGFSKGDVIKLNLMYKCKNIKENIMKFISDYQSSN